MTARELTVLVYVGLGLALAALEIVARVGGRIPTVGVLVRLALRHRSGQLALVLAWWWLGWHFFCDA